MQRAVTGDWCISITATRVERISIVVCGNLDDDRMLLRMKRKEERQTHRILECPPGMLTDTLIFTLPFSPFPSMDVG
jgi:hypothetical protein